MGATSRAECAPWAAEVRFAAHQHQVLPATPDSHGEVIEVVPATAGDHPLINRLLHSVFQSNAPDFEGILDAPCYEPSDRLIIRLGREVVAHAYLRQHVLHVGCVEVKTTDLRHLTALPEYKPRGLMAMILAAADEEMRRDGTDVATVQTPYPEFFRQHGWVPCGRSCQTTISPRDLLAHLRARPAATGEHATRQRSALAVRLWRHCEIDKLADLYAHRTHLAYGAPRRRESEWRWLLSQSAHDRVYVAVERDLSAPDDADAFHAADTIMGFAVLQDNRILELASEEGNVDAARLLLARACADAIENGRHMIELNAAPDDPLHELLVAAGGRHVTSSNSRDGSLMARILDPIGFLGTLRPLLWQRARDAELDAGTAVQLRFGRLKATISVNKRSVAIAENTDCRHWLELNSSMLMRLMLGEVRVRDEIAAGQIRASDNAAAALAATLLPPVSLWRPPLDDLAW